MIASPRVYIAVLTIPAHSPPVSVVTPPPSPHQPPANLLPPTPYETPRQASITHSHPHSHAHPHVAHRRLTLLSIRSLRDSPRASKLPPYPPLLHKLHSRPGLHPAPTPPTAPRPHSTLPHTRLSSPCTHLQEQSHAVSSLSSSSNPSYLSLGHRRPTGDLQLRSLVTSDHLGPPSSVQRHPSSTSPLPRSQAMVHKANTVPMALSRVMDATGAQVSPSLQPRLDTTTTYASPSGLPPASKGTPTRGVGSPVLGFGSSRTTMVHNARFGASPASRKLAYNLASTNSLTTSLSSSSSLVSLPSLSSMGSRDFSTSGSCSAGPSSHGGSSTSSSIGGAPSMASQEDGDEFCWICMDASGSLEKPCKCPRLVHRKCMARWQLQQAGKQEERFCRFCQESLPDWESSFVEEGKPKADPVMVVTLGNRAHHITVRPGEEGQREFQAKVRELFNIPDGVEFEVSFKCRVASGNTGERVDTVNLDGMSSYNAATQCAAAMAAQRVASGNTRGAFMKRGNQVVECPGI